MVVLNKRFYDKITFISRVIADIANRDLECEGIIAEKQGTAYYNIIPQQEINKGKAMLEDIIGAFAEATKQGLAVSGIWHSHGNIPVFHSIYDDFHFYSTVLPLIKKQNKILNKYAETITSIVINNRGEFYSLPENKLTLEGNPEYIDSVELIESISTKISYQGVLLKDMENYEKTLNYYKEVKAAIWQEVFKRGIERLEKKKKVKKCKKNKRNKRKKCKKK